MEHNGQISLQYLLNSRNINGDLYDCDIERWLGVKLDRNKRNEIKSQLRVMAKITEFET